VTELSITLDGDSSWVKPGATVRGEIRWRLEEEAEALELRLFWYTRGRGTEDVEVVSTMPIARPAPAGRYEFAIDVPNGPYSFSGRLITLAWALELVVLPGKESERADLLVSPQPVEIDLR